MCVYAIYYNAPLSGNRGHFQRHADAISNTVSIDRHTPVADFTECNTLEKLYICRSRLKGITHVENH